MRHTFAVLLVSLSLIPCSLSQASSLLSPSCQSHTQGAYDTGSYPNLFHTLLGKSDAEIENRISKSFQQLFHGSDDSERVYYPVGADMAYIEDILNQDVRTEGMSYGMMIAVQLNKKREFDRLWKWAKTHMQHAEGPRQGYFAWHCKADGAPLDPDSASDGEVWFVMALFFASARWGDGDGIYNYSAEAQSILDAMLSKTAESDSEHVITNMFNRREKQVVFVPNGFADAFTDPSYHVPHYYELWARWATRENRFWREAAATSREFLKKAAHPKTGLTPDYAHFDGTPVDAPWGGGHNDFRFDAFRTAMNIAIDWVWFGRDPWAVTQSNRLLEFFHQQGMGVYPNQYTLDGKPLSSDRSLGLEAMNGVAALAATTPLRKAFVQAVWDAQLPTGRYRYYDGLLHLFALLQLSGQFRIHDPAQRAAPPDGNYIAFEKKIGRFPLAASGHAASLYLSSGEFPGVRRVAGHVQGDLHKVTGLKPALHVDATPAERAIVLVGTLGKNPLIDRLVAEKRIDVSDMDSRRETWLIEVVESPLPEVDHALVILGSDKRGTIYGLYDLARQIGVSAWHFWSDVPPPHHDALYVEPGRYTLGEPRVKYRGIFINDEAPALTGWAFEKYGGFNARMYEHVFELILRMKGNYLWPAMWGRMFYVEDPVNPRLADEYGIVIATSHHEPMMRAHAEWAHFGTGKWNYEVNEEVLQAFWREGIRRMDDYESVVTIGMRGDGDEPMSEAANIALLERIVRDQRQIIAEVTGKAAEQTPQVWALYKEVQEYYDKGMRVPDDVTLLLCDDNWGNLRKLPRPDDPPRPGGYGIYYHFDYVGGPRNYKWLNTNQVSRIWEQMHLAYAHGVDRIWIVNVGDIKPMELPTEFFLDYAWNPERWPAERIPEYTRNWAQRQFGPEHAMEIAELLEGYTRFNSRRKPELLEAATYSLHHYQEWERVVRDYDALALRARDLCATLPAAQRDAFYQIVLHPITACANLNRLYATTAQNHLYAKQGRSLTNLLADSVAALFAEDAAISHYYNTELAGGKWSHMMDQTRIGYTYWQQPDENVMPEVKRIRVPAAAEMGVAIEGAGQWWPASDQEAVLPELDPYVKPSCYFEIFNRGTERFAYSISAGKKWLSCDAAKGTIHQEKRLTLNVDWACVPSGHHRVPIVITGAQGRRVVVIAPLFKPLEPETLLGGRFLESNGCAALEAEHYARAVNSPAMFWQKIPELGRTRSGMTPFPVTAPAAEWSTDAPRLEYQLYLFNSGQVTVTAHLSPTLDFHHRGGLRYAISFNEETPQAVNLHEGMDWERWVSDNIVTRSTTHTLDQAGPQVLKFWAIDPGVVLQRLVVETGDAKPSYLGPQETFVPRQGVSQKIQNPVLSGFYPDPSICRVGDTYYLVTSSFAYFPGLPLFKSRDLANWQQIGHVLERPGQLDLEGHGVSRGLFAPSIRYHEGLFYVVCTLVDRGGNFVVTARSAEGPWSDPVWLPQVHGIDPSLFFDDNGSAWLIYNSVAPDDKPLYNGHRTIRLRAFDRENLCVSADEWILVDGGVDISQKPVWIEAPHIFKKAGWYYLIAAEGGTAEWHSEVVFRSKQVQGPYTPWEKNPILTQRHLDPKRKAPVTCTGHADLVETPAGEWWAVFLGCRPYPPGELNFYNTGRETFMAPVSWLEGWPRINPDAVEIQPGYPAPLPIAPASSPLLFSGAFSLRDEFDGTILAPNWQLLRTPREAWYTLHHGAVVMKVRPETCSGTGNPSFLGHRQQHIYGMAATALDFSPRSEHEKAGLIVFQNDTHYYFLCKSRRGKQAVIELYQSTDGKNAREAMHRLKSVVLKEPLHAAGIELKITAAGGSYGFYYAESPGAWKVLLDGVDGTFLSTRVAGGFVGSMYGLYATSLGRPSDNTARFEWFETSGDDSLRP